MIPEKAARFHEGFKVELHELNDKNMRMRETENILEASKLKPDLMGFIFYRESPRYAGEKLDPKSLPESRKNKKNRSIREFRF